ncbi:MAG: glycosyltransferase family 39 protein, partial [Chloroflexota bacterium]
SGWPATLRVPHARIRAAYLRPTYFYVSALVASLIGPGFLPLRLVSMLASVGSMVVVFQLVRRETGSREAGLVATGVLAAANPFVDTAMDIGRVDALFTFLAVAAVFAARAGSLRTGRSRYWALRGWSPYQQRALTKLPAAAGPIAVGVGFGLALTVRRHVVYFALGACVCAGIGILLLRFQTGPWQPGSCGTCRANTSWPDTAWPVLVRRHSAALFRGAPDWPGVRAR